MILCERWKEGIKVLGFRFVPLGYYYLGQYILYSYFLSDFAYFEMNVEYYYKKDERGAQHTAQVPHALLFSKQ